MTDRMLTTEEAAEFLGQAVGTLHNQRSRKVGPKYVKLPGSVRYRLSDLEEYVASCTVETRGTRRD